MKTLKFRKLCVMAALMALVIIFFTSCEEDEPVRPDYVGTWETVESVPTDEGHVQVKEIMTFTETGFTNKAQMELALGKWIDFASMKGTMTVSGDFMNVIVTEIGITSLNMITGLPTGVITSYQKGTDEYDALFAELGESKTFESKFTVAGNKLTLQTDKNEDGDYLDELETSVYTKK